MLIGNSQWNTILRQYISQLTEGWWSSSSFFLLMWSKHIWKTTLVCDIVEEYLWKYMQTDFLYVRDCSDVINKQHILKISLPTDKKNHFIDLGDWNLYHDLWTREITSWLQKSPIGKTKIVFLENIERMNIPASNAFLKTCEEPLAHRIIIASTSSPSVLLDTLLSRAVQIKFHALSFDEILLFCKENDLFSDDLVLQKLVSRIVMGKPWLLFRYQKIFEEDENLKKEFLSSINLLTSKKVFQSHKLLLSFRDAWILDSFLDWWIDYCSAEWMFDQSEKRLSVKKMMKSNVNIDNLLLYWVLK